MGRTAEARPRKRISPLKRHIRALPCRGGSRWTVSRPAPRPDSGQVVPPSGIGRRIRHLATAIGRAPDSVQVMLNRGHLYVGHMFSDGVTMLDASDPRRSSRCGFFTAGAEHAHAPSAGRQRPDAARQRRQHRGDAVLRQPARLFREHARGQHHQPEEVPLGPQHPRHLAAGADARDRLPRDAGLRHQPSVVDRADAMPMSPRISTASPTTSSCIVDLQDIMKPEIVSRWWLPGHAPRGRRDSRRGRRAGASRCIT